MPDKYPWIRDKRHLKGWTKASRDGAYSRAKWLKLREHKLQLNPLCEMCEKQGKVTPATEVDHIIEVSEELGEDDPLFYDLDNLQSLCTKCHRSKTRKSHSKYSQGNMAKGKALMKKLESNDEEGNNR